MIAGGPALATLAGENLVHEFTHDASGRRIRLSLTPDQTGDGPITGIHVMSIEGERRCRTA